MSLLIEGLIKRLVPFYEESEKFPIRRRFNGREIFVITLWGAYNFTGDHIEEMRRNGIKPLSINEILRGLPEEQSKVGIEKMVFFDTPDTDIPLVPGNHFRVVKVDSEFGMTEIKHCNNFGNYDTNGVPSFNVGLNEKLFRGVSIQYYKDGEKLLTLTEAQWTKDRNYTRKGEDIFITERGTSGKFRRISLRKDEPQLETGHFDSHPACCE